MEPVDYMDTFIAVADDCPVERGTIPPGDTSAAARAFRLIRENPYGFTSGDVLFAIHAPRQGIAPAQSVAARRESYTRGRPCPRTSDLCRRYGRGTHADSTGRVALVAMETPEYAEFVSGRRRGASGSTITRAKALRRARVP